MLNPPRLLTLFFSSLFFFNASCYHMPTENEFSVIPTTNNPSITREKNDSLMPSVSY